ncbi:spore cortex-lytic enzyme [Alteribacter aurantiacus]|uniref:spore cortex-lytic enzyme n=1 Tax=Alteribacter aurantiacus TaxID=254410 RepID=UPI0003F6018A|nr:spore cortex-lytic enzyme [Alteribacter aurantiacus]
MKSHEGRRLKRLFFAVLVCVQFVVLLPSLEAQAFTDQVIQKGATGDDVVELQSRLQYIGFYHDTIDGVYGYGTYWSVKKYQEEFGLEPDGLVGPKMKDMLKRTTNFDKEYVHRMLKEGRKFTHYGGMPLEHQKGPKPGGKRGKPAPAPKQPSAPGGEPQKGGAPKEQPSPEAGTPQKGAPQTEAPQEGTPETGTEQPQTDTQQPEAETPAPAPGEDIPDMTPEEDDFPGDEADIQEAINTPEGFTDNDIQIMAQAVYGEARGEPYTGQVAVAAVILNRIESPTFPNNPSGVIFEPRAFTAVADGQINLEPDDTARRAVLDAINGQDPSGNALYYFNPDTATSGWIWSRPQIKRIGKHIFCE